ncbi:MAG: transposase, partial [Rhodospirillales bacterium]|nr:transposase [Rhodospirillales bacterium]
MEPAATDSLGELPDSELRDLIGRLVAEVSGLRATVNGLEARVTVLQAENTALRGEVARLEAENRTLKDEIARLKGLPPRPPLTPSGMERSTEAGGVSKAKRPRSRRWRGPVLPRISITEEVVLTAQAPAGSRFKGYDDIVVQNLDLTARAIRFRRERWRTPSGETVSGTLPVGIRGGFGPALQQFILALHIQGQVTTERLTALLTGMGVVISKRQVVRLLAKGAERFAAEDAGVLRAGLASARWITVDDTAARHARRDGYTTQIGDDRFTAFRTGSPSRGRTSCRSCGPASSAYVVNATALDYMRRRGLPAA